MVILYFLPLLPMFIVIAFLARRNARDGSSAPRLNWVQIAVGLLTAIALGVFAFWLTGMSR